MDPAGHRRVKLTVNDTFEIGDVQKMNSREKFLVLLKNYNSTRIK